MKLLHLPGLLLLSLALLTAAGCGGSGSGNSDAGAPPSTRSSTPPAPPPTPVSSAADPAAASTGATSANPATAAASSAATASAGPSVLKAGSPAPEFRLPRPSGGNLSLASLKGKVVLLNFWATWCVPCLSEMPDLEKLYQKFRSQGLEVVGVTLPSIPSTETKQESIKVLKEKQITYPTVLCDTATAQHYDTEVLPTTVLVDREGRIVTSISGKPSPSAADYWQPLLEKALSSR